MCFSFFKFIYWLPRRFRLTLSSPERAKPWNRILYFTRLGIDLFPHLASGSYYCFVDPQAAFLLFIKTALAQMKRDKSPLLVVSRKREYFHLPREGRKRNHPVSLDYAVDDNYNPFNLLTWQSRESFTSFSLSPVIMLFIRLVGVFTPSNRFRRSGIRLQNAAPMILIYLSVKYTRRCTFAFTGVSASLLKMPIPSISTWKRTSL